MALGRPLGAKLFLEGKEVPFIGATITSAVNQASIAYVDLVPHSAINDIKPRTSVEIAVRDYNNVEQHYPYVTAWSGEVFGYSFGKTVGSRSFSISCIDSSSHWDNALLYYMNAQQSLGKAGLDLLRDGLDFDAAQKLKLRTLVDPGPSASYFSQIIKKTLENKDSDFLDAFVDILKSLVNVNDFYSFAEKRLRIQDRIILRSSGALKNLLDQKQGQDWFNDIAGKAGGFTSVRAVVQDLLSLIFHDFVPMPFPSRVEREKLAGAKLTGPTPDNKKTTVGSYVFKPNLYMVPPPLCNVFFPDEYSQFNYSRNFFKEPTRLIYKPELPFFQSTEQPVALPYAFEPPSFQNFMIGGDDWSKFQGTDDLAVPVGEDPGGYSTKAPSDYAYKASTNGVYREGQFLTNEERIKGIWMAQENLMPATTQFNTALGGVSKTKVDFTQKVAKYLFYKKRFENRSLQITSHLKLSVIPGFNVLVLDDSAAEQTVLAYCSSVTHRIYATEGGYTNVTLSYARTPGEEKQASGKANEPVIPPWFDEVIFGETTAKPTSEAAKDEVKAAGSLLQTPQALSDFYQALIGSKGYKAITNYFPKEPTVIGAVARLLQDYREQKNKGAEDLQSFISTVTSRDYVRIRDAMRFIGATLPNGVDLRIDNFVDFTGGAFDPNDSVTGPATKLKQAPIIKYRDALMQYRGFRG